MRTATRTCYEDGYEDEYGYEDDYDYEDEDGYEDVLRGRVTGTRTHVPSALT
jgi:hypothetical protein